MPNLNRVMLMGNLTRDPELRYTPGNLAVTNIGLAINRRWKNQQTNEWQEEATFIDCEAWGKTAETLSQYLKKGKPLYVEGRLKLDSWQDKESGQNRSKLKVVVESFQFIDSRQGGEGGGGDDGGGYQDAGPPQGGGGYNQSRGGPPSGGRGPGGPPSGGRGPGGPPSGGGYNQNRGGGGRGAAPSNSPPPEAIDEDDIPF